VEWGHINKTLRFAEIIGNIWCLREALSLAETEFLSRKEASSFLHRLGCPVSARTLEKLAANNNAGAGPPFYRFRWKAVRYAKTELVEWARRETVRVT
jgi:hypothetical protein